MSIQQLLMPITTPPLLITATGGTIEDFLGNNGLTYRRHKFTTSGIFRVSAYTSSSNTIFRGWVGGGNGAYNGVTVSQASDGGDGGTGGIFQTPVTDDGSGLAISNYFNLNTDYTQSPGAGGSAEGGLGSESTFVDKNGNHTGGYTPYFYGGFGGAGGNDGTSGQGQNGDGGTYTGPFQIGPSSSVSQFSFNIASGNGGGGGAQWPSGSAGAGGTSTGGIGGSGGGQGSNGSNGSAGPAGSGYGGGGGGGAGGNDGSGDTIGGAGGNGGSGSIQIVYQLY